MKQRIVEMLRAGKTYSQIVSVLGCSRGTIAYHARALGLPKRGRKPIYDWPAIRKFYEEGHSVTECVAEFGFSMTTWTDATKRGVVSTRSARPLSELAPSARSNVKRRILREGLLLNVCSECGLDPVWNGKPLTLVLDHVNGVRGDHRRENLRLLCPNCNSQTETFSGRNVKTLRKRSDVAQ